MPRLKSQIELLKFQINVLGKEIDLASQMLNYITKSRCALKSSLSLDEADQKTVDYINMLDKKKEERNVLQKRLNKLEKSANNNKQPGNE